MADEQTIARIDAYIKAQNGDFTIRCGSLNDTQDEADRVYTGEIANSTQDFVIGPNGAGVTSLGEALDDLDAQIGRLGGA